MAQATAGAAEALEASILAVLAAVAVATWLMLRCGSALRSTSSVASFSAATQAEWRAVARRPAPTTRES